MKALLLLPLLLLPACSRDSPGSDPAPSPTVASGAVLSTDGALLRAPVSADPGPATPDPACEEFAKEATCVAVGTSRWVTTRDTTGWVLREYDVTEELERWVVGLEATGNGQEPRVVAVDLTDGQEPEALVQYAGSFDLVSTGDIGIPQVVAHGDGVATVSQDGREVRVQDARLERSGEQWVLAP